MTATTRRVFGIFGLILGSWSMAACSSSVTAPSKAQHTASPPSLAGEFLVAAPSMRDPRFSGTVILMVRHDTNGAMGLVINRPFGEGSLSRLLAGFGVTSERQFATVRLNYGGPVEPQRGFVVHSPDYAGPSTQPVVGALSVSTGRDVLEAIGAGTGPRRVSFILGYAGWGPGQLESELARQDWLTAPADPSLIFSADPNDAWDKAYRSAGLSI